MAAYVVDMTASWPNLRALELFVAIANEGSVGAGARKVGMAQPNASRAVSDLETATRMTLLERSARGSIPTEFGQLLAAQAREVLGSAQRFNAWVRAREESGSDLELRIGASMTIAECLLPTWLARLRDRLPQLRVDLRVLNSVQVLHEVNDGDLQLGFVETPDVPVGFNATVVQQDELIVVVPPDHPWATRGSSVSTKELAATPLVVREPGSGTRDALDASLARFDPVAPAQVLSSNTAVRLAVASGAGPAALSKFALRSQLANGELVRVSLEGNKITRPLTAVWRGSGHLRGRAAELIAIAQASPA